MDLLYFSVQIMQEVNFSCWGSSVTVVIDGIFGINIFSNVSIMLFIPIRNNKTLCLYFYKIRI